MRHLQSPWTPVGKIATAYISVRSLQNILDDTAVCMGLWLPGSPHLHPSDFWCMLRSKVCSNIPRSEHDLKTDSQNLALLLLPAGILCIVNNVLVRCDPKSTWRRKIFSVLSLNGLREIRILSAIQWPTMNGTWLAADWSSGEKCLCHHAKWFDWGMMRFSR
jgi:hypothetical protein